MSHDNRNVREVVIRHMTLLIKTNRDLFQNLILNEELSSMNFLTVVHDPSSLNAALGKVLIMHAFPFFDQGSILNTHVRSLCG